MRSVFTYVRADNLIVLVYAADDSVVNVTGVRVVGPAPRVFSAALDDVCSLHRACQV